jgi:hypothetical protein
MQRDKLGIQRTMIGVLACAGMLSCAPPPAVPTTRPEAVAPPVVAVDPLSAPWEPHVGTGSIAQELRFEASLVSRVDTVERRDTIRTVVNLEWSRVAGEAASRISGLLTGFRISADTTEPVPPSALALPLPFSALDGVGAIQARLTRPEPTSCGLDAAATHAIREVLISLPRRLEPGTTWTDSASYGICRDSIPLSVRSERRYTVTGAERRDGQLVVLVERRSSVTMNGAGRQFGEEVVLDATGEGTATLVVRLSGAFVIAGSGESDLRMTMRGRRRSQELTQHTRIEIVTP